MKRLTLSTHEPILAGVLTPSTTEGGDAPAEEPEHDQDTHAMAMRWQEALDQCQDKLMPSDRKTISTFRTPDEVLKHLKQKEAECNDTLVRQLIAQIYPCLISMRSLSVAFLAYMQPRTIETALLWGVLHLAIKGQIVHTAILAKFVKMLESIRQEFAEFQKSAAILNDHLEIRHALVDMFISLINFWVEAVRFLARNNVENTLIAAWPDLNKNFSEALESIDQAVKRVHRLASLCRLGDEYHRKQENDEHFLSLIGINEESSTTFPCYEIPSSIKHFCARSKELAAMTKVFHSPNENKDHSSLVVFGLGGVGKTALTHAFVDQCIESKLYDAIFWIRSETPAEFRNSFTDIALRLELPRARKDADSNSNVILVKNWLGKTKKRWFLVYDNVEDLELMSGFLPPIAGPMLITTRSKKVAFQAQGPPKRLELEAFDEIDGEKMFDALSAVYNPGANLEDEKEEKRSLLKQIGGLALGIEQIAAYIGYRNLTVKKFLSKYERMSADIHKKNECGSLHTLATVWEMHFEHVQNTHAGNLLSLLSMLSPDVIPLDLFLPPEDELDNSHMPLIGHEEKVEDAVDLLMSVALIKRDGDDVSLHRLVQKAFIQSHHGFGSSSGQKSFNIAILLVNHRFPKMGGPLSLYGRWAECAKYFHHSLALVEVFKTSKKNKQPFKSSYEFVELLKNCAWYLYEIGEMEESLRIVGNALDACDEQEGLLAAQLYNNAGCAHYELNDLVRCREGFERCHAIRSVKLAEDDNDLGNIYSNIASLLLSEKRLDESLEMYYRAWNIRSKHGSEDYIATNALSIGRVHFEKREYEIAEKWYDETKKMVTEGTWVTSILLYAIGNLELARGNFSAARKTYLEAYNITRDQGNTSHMFSATILYKLAMAKAELGDVDEALRDLDQALSTAKYRDMQGAVARIMRRKGLVLKRKQSPSQAEVAETDNLRLQAETLRMKVSADVMTIGRSGGMDDDEAYDDLVCGYHR